MVLTKKQQLVLDFIKKFINSHGYSPSYREIMTGLEMRSIATVAEHVNNLVAKGYLAKKDGSARSLEPVTPSALRIGSEGGIAGTVPANKIDIAATASGDVQYLFRRKLAEYENNPAATAILKEAIDLLGIKLF
jgi:repressor LexA